MSISLRQMLDDAAANQVSKLFDVLCTDLVVQRFDERRTGAAVQGEATALHHFRKGLSTMINAMAGATAVLDELEQEAKKSEVS